MNKNIDKHQHENKTVTNVEKHKQYFKYYSVSNMSVHNEKCNNFISHWPDLLF